MQNPLILPLKISMKSDQIVTNAKNFLAQHKALIKGIGFVGYMVLEHVLGQTEVGSAIGVIFKLLGI